MKVLISGYYGFYNIGDEAILKSIIIALKEEKPDIEIVVLSNDVRYTEENYGVRAINRWNPIEIYRELLDSNGLISGGGSLFQDVTSSRSVIYYSSIILLAKIARKPIFVYAQGVGPIYKKINQKIVKSIFNKCDFITLRDKESKKLVQSIGVKKYIDIVPDPVMGLKLSQNNNIKLLKIQKKYVTVSVRDWKNSNNTFLEDLAHICDYIIESNIDVIFIPMHGEIDEKFSKEIAKIMKHKPIVLSKDLTMEEKIFYIKNSKLMIGMRLHALIFAATVGTPMIGISYDPKIDSYLQLLDQVSIGNVNEKLDVNKLCKLIIDKVNVYEIEKERLEKYTLKLKLEASNTASKVIQKLDKKNNN